MKNLHRPCRLTIFTGKGGVGKTTLAQAYTQMLKQEGYNACYVTLGQQKFTDSPNQQKLTLLYDVPHLDLQLEDCLEGYIAKKLKSTLVAKFIVHADFFRHLVNMLPGFSYVIYLGKMIETLTDPTQNYYYVLDAPASGHAVAMMEATKHFKTIFKSGVVFEDTEKMLRFLHDDEQRQIVIVTLATEFALTEAAELKQQLQDANHSSRVFLNAHFLEMKNLESPLPSSFELALNEQERVLSHSKLPLDLRIPYFPFSQNAKAREDLLNCLKNYFQSQSLQP